MVWDVPEPRISLGGGAENLCPVVVTCLIPMTKIPVKNNLGKAGFALARGLRLRERQGIRSVRLNQSCFIIRRMIEYSAPQGALCYLVQNPSTQNGTAHI